MKQKVIDIGKIAILSVMLVASFVTILFLIEKLLSLVF
jgi:hypothetical protein